MSSGSQSVVTPPVTPEEIKAESPQPQCDSPRESNRAKLSGQHLLSTIQHFYTLWPWLPIIWDHLYHIHERPQVRTLNFVSIPLPYTSSDDKSEPEASDTPEEVKADSPCQYQDESLTCRARARPTPMTGGRVTNYNKEIDYHPQTSGGITNAPVPGLLTDAQKRHHKQSSTPEQEDYQDVPGPPPEQLPKAMTREETVEAVKQDSFNHSGGLSLRTFAQCLSELSLSAYQNFHSVHIRTFTQCNNTENKHFWTVSNIERLLLRTLRTLSFHTSTIEDKPSMPDIHLRHFKDILCEILK